MKTPYIYLPKDYHNPGSFNRPDVVDQKLYVIAPIFNPQRYSRRWELYEDFKKYVLNSGEAHLVTIECAFGNRAFVLKEEENPNHTLIQVRSSQEIWLKENLINLAIQRLPLGWKYVAWIDADVTFARPDWVGETIQQLQHYHVVQMFSESHDMNNDYECIKIHKGLVWCYKNQESQQIPAMKRKMPAVPDVYYGSNPHDRQVSYWHPGFAWAARKEAIDSLGGLIDWGILGGGDTFMAYALLGMLNKRTMPKSLGDAGVRWLQEWQTRADKYIKKNVGFISGIVYHHWHGSRKDRAYWDRGTILTQANFSPEKDLKKDWQGVWQLNPENIKLRDDARAYFSQRNEDSIT